MVSIFVGSESTEQRPAGSRRPWLAFLVVALLSFSHPKSAAAGAPVHTNPLNNDPLVRESSPLGEYTTQVSAADLKIWGDAMKKFGGFGGTIDYAGLVDTGK